MRQASWGEIFAPRYQPEGITPDVPAEPSGWKRLIWWEDLVTFGLLGVILLAVITSIQSAHWVRTMPSLYPIAFFGLFLGALLACLRWREGFIHLLALPIGAAATLGQIMSILPGGTPLARWDVLHDRMAGWFHVAVYGGISNDDLPFIVLVVPLVWLTAYLSAWAIFRWQNAWLALVPAGAVLLVNVSFLSVSGFSLSFVIFLLGSVLLATRLNLLERAKAWRAGQTPYPPLISLSVLHATFWLALVLLGLAWLMPQADKTGAFATVWQKASSPVNERVLKLTRLFVSVHNKQSYQVHDFGQLLPFLGSIQLSDKQVADVTASSSLSVPSFLRAQAYDTYTAHGWVSDISKLAQLAQMQSTGADQALLDRQSVHISVLPQSDNGRALLTVGQPLTVDRQAAVEQTGSPQTAGGLVSPSAIEQGDAYASTGSVSTANAPSLRAAGLNYPGWTRPFLQLPRTMPARVGALAQSWTAGKDTPYDKAVAIESQLRDGYAYDLNVPDTPPGRDTVDYFLFDVKRGYFDYHASAMVVLLRSLGIPSRLAVGYVLDPQSLDAGMGTFHITEGNAFAWPEVYFPGYGWVEFNPTPNHPAAARASSPANVAASSTPSSDAGLNLNDLNPARSIPASDSSIAAAQTPGSSSHLGWIIAAIAGGLALIVVSGAGGLRYAWVRGLSGLDTPARLWGQTARLASWARAAPATDETPAEFARNLRTHVPGTEGAEQLAKSYVRHRYGRDVIDPAESERLKGTWRGVRKALIRRVLHLA
jgi:transglutaminase-like putative cysteine protease